MTQTNSPADDDNVSRPKWHQSEWTWNMVDPGIISAPSFMNAFKYVWMDAKAKARRIARRDVAFVRNWQAVPIISEGKAKWALTFERRRFFMWCPVTCGFMDSLEDCKALVEHRYRKAVELHVRGDGKVQDRPMTTGEKTMTAVFKAVFDATSVLSERLHASHDVRPEGSAAGAAPAGGDGEVPAQPSEATRDGETQGSEAPENETSATGEAGATKETAQPVPGESP